MTDIYRKFNAETRSITSSERVYSGQENDSLSTTLHFSYDPIDFLKKDGITNYKPFIMFGVYDEDDNPLVYGPDESSSPAFDGYTFSIPWDVTSRVKTARVEYQLFFVHANVEVDARGVTKLDSTQYIQSAVDGITLKPSISCKSRRNPCACPPMAPMSEPNIVGYINLWKEYGVVTPIISGVEGNTVVLKFQTYSGNNESIVKLDNVPALIDGKILIDVIPTGHTENTIPLLKGEIGNGKSIMYDAEKGGFVEYEIVGIYQFRGTCKSVQLDEMAESGTTLTGDALAVGMVYSLTDTRDYGGETYKVGTNWVWSEEGRWEPLTGDLDLSEYQRREFLVDSWDSHTAEQYPSARLTFESLETKMNKDVLTDEWSADPSAAKVPSERLVKTELDSKINGAQIADDLLGPSDDKVPSTNLLVTELDKKLDTAQLTTSWTVPVASDDHIPSEKLVKDSLENKTNKIEAIPVWDRNTVYKTGSTVIYGGTNTIYISKADDNQDQLPTEQTSWWAPIQGGGGGEGGGSVSTTKQKLGNGVDKEFIVPHGYGVDFFYSLRTTSDKRYVDADVYAVNSRDAKVVFSEAPLEDEYQIMICPGAGSGGGPSDMRSFSGTIIGDGQKDSFVINHNLDTENLVWSIRSDRGNKEGIQTQFRIETTKQAVVNFSAPPEVGENIRICIIGLFNEAIQIWPEPPKTSE